MTTTSLICSLVFGSIGMGYFIYGKKQQRLVPWIAGLGLCVLPYLMTDDLAVVLVGALLTASPWLLRE